MIGWREGRRARLPCLGEPPREAERGSRRGPAGGPPASPRVNTHACSVAFDRPRLSSRSCAAVKAHPHVPHLQLVNALVTRLGPSLLVWGCFARPARTTSPPHS